MIETIGIVLGLLTAIGGLAVIALSWDDIKFAFGRKAAP